MSENKLIALYKEYQKKHGEMYQEYIGLDLIKAKAEINRLKQTCVQVSLERNEMSDRADGYKRLQAENEKLRMSAYAPCPYRDREYCMLDKDKDRDHFTRGKGW